MPKPPLSPALWPFAQPGVLLAIKQREHAAEQERLKTSTAIRDVDFQDADEEDTDYSPSEDVGDGDEEDDAEEDPSSSASSSQDSAGPMEVDINEGELQDLAREIEENSWPHPPTPSERAQAEEAEFEAQLAILHREEKKAAAAYNPDEVVALLTELFELLVELAHWSLGSFQKAPHTDPAVDVGLARELGFDEAAVDLMLKLPYVSNVAIPSPRAVVPDARFIDYRRERDMRAAKLNRGYDQYEAPIDAWILPLVTPRNREGWYIVLDTRLGVIRAFTPMGWPPGQGIEFTRYKHEAEGSGPLEYHKAPLVSAATYIRTLIDCYRPLDYLVPMMDAYHADPDFANRDHPANLNSYYENMQDEQASIMALYKECGWPDHWDRPRFVERWKTLEWELKQRGWQRMERGGMN